MKNIKVTSIQMDCETGYVKSNLVKSVSLFKKAKVQGADFAVLPELSNVGYKLDELKNLHYDLNDTIHEFSIVSKELNIHVAAGVLEKKVTLIF